ncbi:transglutaminase, partial [Clostridioides difficile]
DYSLYDEQDAVKGHAALKTKVQSTLKEGGTSLTFRYKGTEAGLIEDLQDLYQLGMKSISYYVSKMEGTTDLRVKINWTL